MDLVKEMFFSIDKDGIVLGISFFWFNPYVNREIIGPNKNTLIAPAIILFQPNSELNIVKIIIIDKKFNVEDPWAKAITDSREDPLFFNEFTTGTMQAEHKLSAGAMI